MLSQVYWLNLSIITRNKLAEAFDMHKSGHTIVVDNQVTSDGYTPKDLLGITVEKLQAFTKSPSVDFYALMDLAVKAVAPVQPKPTSPVAFANGFTEKAVDWSVIRCNECGSKGVRHKKGCEYSNINAK